MSCCGRFFGRFCSPCGCHNAGSLNSSFVTVHLLDTGLTHFRGIERTKIEAMTYYRESLLFAGFLDTDPTIGNIFECLTETTSLESHVVAEMSVEEFETDIVTKFQLCKTQDDGTIVKTPPGATVRARVRLSHKFCLEQANPTGATLAVATIPTQPPPEVPPQAQAQLDAVTKITEHLATLTANLGQKAPHTPRMDITSTVGIRKLKLKELVDQVSEEECELLTDQQVLACYARWETLMGTNEKPPENQDPTPEQLSAINHLIKVGVVPYADF